MPSSNPWTRAKFYPYKGQRLTLRQISKLTGVHPETLRERWKKHGDFETRKRSGVPKKYPIAGEMLTFREMAERYQMPLSTVMYRYRQSRTLDPQPRKERPQLQRKSPPPRLRIPWGTPKQIEAFHQRIEEIRSGKKSEYKRSLPFDEWSKVKVEGCDVLYNFIHNAVRQLHQRG